MANHTTKYAIGDQVRMYGVLGTIVSIYIRQRGHCYGVGYLNKDVPSEVTCEEIELSLASNEKLGFKKS